LIQQNRYLEPKRFPLTTQEDLDLDEQRLLDAVQTDSLREFRENGGTFSPRQEAIAKELEEKANWHHDSDEPDEQDKTP
jgi:hypothetical protein